MNWDFYWFNLQFVSRNIAKIRYAKDTQHNYLFILLSKKLFIYFIMIYLCLRADLCMY